MLSSQRATAQLAAASARKKMDSVHSVAFETVPLTTIEAPETTCSVAPAAPLALLLAHARTSARQHATSRSVGRAAGRPGGVGQCSPAASLRQ